MFQSPNASEKCAGVAPSQGGQRLSGLAEKRPLTATCSRTSRLHPDRRFRQPGHPADRRVREAGVYSERPAQAEEASPAPPKGIILSGSPAAARGQPACATGAVRQHCHPRYLLRSAGHDQQLGGRCGQGMKRVRAANSGAPSDCDQPCALFDGLEEGERHQVMSHGDRSPTPGFAASPRRRSPFR